MSSSSLESSFLMLHPGNFHITALTHLTKGFQRILIRPCVKQRFTVSTEKLSSFSRWLWKNFLNSDAWHFSARPIRKTYLFYLNIVRVFCAAKTQQTKLSSVFTYLTNMMSSQDRVSCLSVFDTVLWRNFADLISCIASSNYSLYAVGVEDHWTPSCEVIDK